MIIRTFFTTNETKGTNLLMGFKLSFHNCRKCSKRNSLFS